MVMNMRSSGAAAAVWTGLRVVLATLAGLVLMLSAVALAVVVGTVLLLRRWIGARRDQTVRFGRCRAAEPRPRASQRDVIDVEVREIATREMPSRSPTP